MDKERYTDAGSAAAMQGKSKKAKGKKSLSPFL
jgi:hypothetical protein